MANEFIARKGLISSGSVNVSGSVTASFFKGDGSQLTNLPAAAVLSSSVSIDTYTFTGDGSTKNYILSQSYDVSSLFVSVEGLSQTNIQDYTLTGATLSFVSAPPASSNILVKALLNVTQNMTGSFSGSFFGILASASYATTASFATSASWAPPTSFGTGTSQSIALFNSSTTLTSSGILQIGNKILITGSTNYLGIGRSLPAYELDVNGTLRVGGQTPSADAIIIGTNAYASYFQSVGTQYFNLQMGARDAFSIGYSTGNVSIDVNQNPDLLPNKLNIKGNVTASSYTSSVANGVGFLGTASYAANADLLDGLNSTVFATTGSNTFVGNQSASGNIEAGVNLVSNFSSGDEGGQLELARSQTNTSISGSVVIDVFQNRVRIFEKNSPNRGGYWDVTGLAAGVGTNLAGGGGTVTSITAGNGLTGGTITGTGTITIDTGSTHFSSGVVRVLPAGTVSSSTQQVVSTYTNATDNYVLTSTGTGGINGESALLFDGAVLSVTTNNAKYFQGGDDAALYDVNVANTIGIYGVQDSTVGAIKLGSGGKTIYSNATGIGIGTTSPGAFLHVQGNVSASSFTGALAYSSLTGVPGGLVSSSAQYPGWVTSSAQINTGSFTGSFTGSAKFNAAPIILVVDNHAFVGNGVTTNYTLSSSYDPAVLTVSIEGLLQTQTTDYTLSGTTLSFVATPPTSSNIFVKAFRLALV